MLPTIQNIWHVVFIFWVDSRLNHFLTAIEPSSLGSRLRPPHSECVFAVFVPAKKHRLGKHTRIWFKQSTHRIMSNMLNPPSYLVCTQKNIPSTRKQCLRTTWRVNPKYMQFTTPFCPNNTPKALHAVWWFEAAGFLSCAVDFSSLIPSLLEQSCVWRCVC